MGNDMGVMNGLGHDNDMGVMNGLGCDIVVCWGYTFLD